MSKETLFGHYGLSHSQYIDCLKDNRSPMTGKRYPKSSNSKLARISRQSNWNKLKVKGSAANLLNVAHSIHITNDAELVSLTKAISKIESILLNRLSELYEAQRAYELNERAKWKADGWGKPTNEHFKETIKDNFAEQYLLSSPPLAEK